MISMLRELLTFLGAHFYLALIGCGELVLAVILLTALSERRNGSPAAGARDRPRLRAGAADAAGTGGAGGRGVSVAAPERFAAALCGGGPDSGAGRGQLTPCETIWPPY